VAYLFRIRGLLLTWPLGSCKKAKIRALSSGLETLSFSSRAGEILGLIN